MKKNSFTESTAIEARNATQGLRQRFANWWKECWQTEEQLADEEDRDDSESHSSYSRKKRRERHEGGGNDAGDGGQ